MHKVMRNVTTLFDVEKAEKLVEQLNGGDDDWTYRVDRLAEPMDKAAIAVFDENGEFIDWMGSPA